MTTVMTVAIARKTTRIGGASTVRALKSPNARSRCSNPWSGELVGAS